MTANVGILTEREFKMIDGIEEELYSRWREEGIFTPLISLDETHPLFFQNHVDFYFQLKSLIEQGYTIEQIRGAMVNEQIDMDELQRLNPAARYVGLSRRELYDLVREMQVRYSGSMSKEQLYICLTEPNRINEMILQVRPNANITEPETSVSDTVENTVETNVPLEVIQTEQTEVADDEVVQIEQEEVANEEVVDGTELVNYEAMSHSALASLAREQNIRYSRQMSKNQLITCLMNPAEVERIVELVRQEARNRRIQNESQVEVENEVVPEERPRRVRISRLMDVGERTMNGTIVQEELAQEPVVVEENIVQEQLELDTLLDIQNINESEDIQASEITETDTDENIQPAILVLPNGSSIVVQMTPFTACTRDVLQGMATKDIASLVRDANLFPYFRRMNKPELIDALMNPQTRTNYVLIAWERYQIYVNR